MTRRYGWRPDTPDQRDLRFPLRVSAASLPQSVDLRAGCSPVADQGQLGSCTGHAIAGALEYNWLRNHSAPRAASRLFIYYQERVIEHTVPLDAGAMIRDGIKACAKVGVCSEKNWPYRPERFAKKPGVRAYADAAQHRVKLYRRVSGLLDFKIALALNHPVVFGFSVYESFESDHVATTGVMSLPLDTEQMLGGHAVCAVGYDDTMQRAIVRNSWGPDWGDKGYFYMPYGYIEDRSLSDDYWLIES
jgi:C1A family cysteine protease